MNEYEIMLLTRSDLDEDGRSAIVDRAKDAVATKGGSWGTVLEWGRRKTTYPIQKLPDAWYQVLQFDGTGETVDEAVRVLRITDGVLRVMATNRVAAYPKGVELERISDEELASESKDRSRGGSRGPRGGGAGRGYDRN